jgi:hypothetical protein
MKIALAIFDKFLYPIYYVARPIRVILLPQLNLDKRSHLVSDRYKVINNPLLVSLYLFMIFPSRSGIKYMNRKKKLINLFNIQIKQKNGKNPP